LQELQKDEESAQEWFSKSSLDGILDMETDSALKHKDEKGMYFIILYLKHSEWEIW
jgi:hypothetical protein